MLYRSGCKINIGLRILDKREDGYHNLETLFYPLSKPFDEIYIEKTREIGIHVSCNVKDIDPQKNTLTKAYTLYNEKISLDFGLKIELKKGVPHGAGLGGGSANAATILSYLNTQTNNALPFENLLKLSAKVGADVPFFLYNTPCLAKGIGDILEPCSFSLKGNFLLLLMPNISISTPWAFNALTEYKKQLTTKKEQDNYTRSLFLEQMYYVNDFEEVVFKEYYTIQKAKEIMLQNGAIFSSLSGTGSALFGIFTENKHIENTIRELSKQKFFQLWKYVSLDNI